MIVHLSGERYINTEHIENIDKLTQSEYATPWRVWMVSGDVFSMTQVQFEELMLCLPMPLDGERRRKRHNVIARIGASAWVKMSEDEQADALGAEVIA